MENFYRKNKSNVDLFESYALQLVSGMLLYERIKLKQKKLYLEAIKNLIEYSLIYVGLMIARILPKRHK
jgi:Na+/H+-translocating membrane pyrophosphatase